MNLDYNIRKITSLYDNCSQCGLPSINCICDKISKIRSHAKFWILSTEREFYRPSNTARLIKLSNPDSTEVFLWERTKFPEELIEKINDEKYIPYLLFPAEDDAAKNRKVIYKAIGKIPAFIIIDGTWKEAKKIFKKSECLNKVQIISLEPNYKSKYDLRKGADSGHLCTIETAIEVLKLSNEIKSSKIVDEVYNLFLKSFKASISGHQLKE